MSTQTARRKPASQGGAPAPAPISLTSALHPTQPHWRRFGPTWGTLSAATGTLATAMAAGHGLPLALLPVGSIAGAAGAMAAGASRDLSGRHLLWRAGCWVCCGGWATWAAATTPWGAWQLGGLAVGSLAAGWTATTAERRRRRQIEAAALRGIEAAEMAAADAPAREWIDRIRRVADIRVSAAVVPWPGGNGYTVHVRLPEGGVGFDDLAAKVVKLASDADLDVGCEITARRGETRRTMMLDVTTMATDLRKVRHLTDFGLRRISDDLDIGLLRNGQQATINLRYHCVAMAGQTDAGKSNQLQVINTQVARCEDAVLWHIDLTGGNLSRAWVRPWYRRECGHPIVDWVAANERQAAAMLDAALAIIDGRRSGYDEIMNEAGDDKLPVSPEIPEIVIVVDEIHRLPSHLRKKLVDISDTGRGAAVRTVSCGLRAIDTYLPNSIVAQARVRIGMRVSDEKETNYLFGWRDKVDPSSMPYQGCGMLYQGEEGQASLVPFRGYRMEPPRIRDAAMALADWRPPLDQFSQQLADTATRGAYTRRWADTLPLLFSDAGADSPEGEGDVMTDADPARENAADMVDRIFNMTADERASTKSETQERVAQLRAESEERRREEEADRAAVELTLSDMGITTADRLMALIDDAGPNGIATGELEKLSVEHKIGSRATVHRNLSKMVEDGLILRPPGRVVAARFAESE